MLFEPVQSNILIDDTQHPCIADFGLANFTDLTQSSSRNGSTYWMAPELISPEEFNLKFKRTTASDVYALGCTYFEVVFPAYISPSSDSYNLDFLHRSTLSTHRSQKWVR
jgi:serine/threonine protein kinase